MDRSWFDSDDLDLGLGLNRRWTSLASHSSGVASSFLEESRSLDATSTRLRDAVTSRTGLLASRRLDLAHRINTFMRSSGEAVKPTHAEFEELTKNFRAMKEENLKLKAVITDVTEVNKRWQKYNNDRQIYVQRLLSTIQDQQEQINKVVTNSAFLPPAKALHEGSEISALHEEVVRLRQKIDQLEREHSETIQVLKFQVKAHHDDWEAERREKQQALQEKLAAEAKIRQLQKDLRSHKLKLREERLENENRCSCCCGPMDAEHDMDLEPPTARLNYCRNEHTKTYRTSVHVPCNAGHLLSRGSTLSFDDDLAIDGNTNKSDQQNAQTSYEISNSRSSSDKCLSNKTTSEERDNVVSNLEFASAATLNRNGTICSKYQVDVKGSGRDKETTTDEESVGLPQSDSLSTVGSTSRLSCSILHIPSTHNSSTASLPAESTKCEPPNGVTIGFNNNGLASVLSFPQTPIVKSFSLPNPTDSKSGQETFVQSQSLQQNSLNSTLSGLPVASKPEIFTVSAESLLHEKKPSKLSLLGAFAKSVKQSQSSSQYRYKSEETNVETSQEITWRPKYFEEGVDTQTREDIICPVCDLLFPPTSHVKFLDHFGKCQNIKAEQKIK